MFRIVPGYLSEEKLRLRPVRLSDGPFMKNGFGEKDVLEANGSGRQMSASWFFVWWWIKKTYVYSYCIDLDSRPIGFIGLYNLRPDKSADISLAIFDSVLRRNGYGTRAFRLFAKSLQRHPALERIFVSVQAENYAARSFWRHLGFGEATASGGIVDMSLDL